jgi:hypothetical protein
VAASANAHPQVHGGMDRLHRGQVVFAHRNAVYEMMGFGNSVVRNQE